MAKVRASVMLCMKKLLSKGVFSFITRVSFKNSDNTPQSLGIVMCSSEPEQQFCRTLVENEVVPRMRSCALTRSNGNDRKAVASSRLIHTQNILITCI